MSVSRLVALKILSKTGADSHIGRLLLTTACRRHGAGLQVNAQQVAIHRDARTILLRRSQLILAPAVAEDFINIWEAVSPVQGDSDVLDFSCAGEKMYHPLGRVLRFNGFPDLISPDDDYLRYARINQGDLCFDLGANVGVVSLALAQRVAPGGRVIALEPDPGNAAALDANVADISPEIVTVVRAAVSTQSGTGSFVAEGGVTSHLAELHGDTVLREQAGDTITCETVSIEDLITRFGTPRFAKIDIEGFEVPVLEAAASRLFDCGVDLALDTHHPYGSDFTRVPVEDILRGVGYKVQSEQVNGAWMTWAIVPSSSESQDRTDITS